MENFFVFNLKTKIELNGSQIHKNYRNEIYYELKKKFENKCNRQTGYVRRESIKILDIDMCTSVNTHLKGKFAFDVKFTCHGYKPLPGQKLKCIVKNAKPVGFMCRSVSYNNLSIIVPFSLIDDVELKTNASEIKPNRTIEVEIIDSQLIAGTRQNRYESIYQVIGKLTEIYEDNDNVLNLALLDTNPITSNIELFSASSEDEKVIMPLLLEMRRKIEALNSTFDRIYSSDSSSMNRIFNIRPETGTSNLWDFCKKLAYKYENVRSLAKLNVVSRAFYKMYELINPLDLISIIKENKNLRVLNLAESPGGFIQALLYARAKYVTKSVTDIFYAVSISEKKGGGDRLWTPLETIIKEFRIKSAKYKINTHILNSDDDPSSISFDSIGTGAGEGSSASVVCAPESKGNLFTQESFEYVSDILKFRRDFDDDATKSKGADLITADGGHENEAELKEISHHRLIFSEIYFALKFQAVGGTFILKIYDVFTELSNQMIALLTMYYSNVKIVKPKTSRFANSEKYVICTGFIDIFNNMQAQINLSTLDEIFDNLTKIIGSDDKYLKNLFDIDLPESYKENIKTYNTNFVELELSAMKKSYELGQRIVNFYNSEAASSPASDDEEGATVAETTSPTIESILADYRSDQNKFSRDMLASMDLEVKSAKPSG